MSRGTAPPGIIEAVLAVLAKTPQLLGLVVAGRLSGQFWLYVLMARTEASERRIKYINNHIGITVLGLISFVPEFVVLYFFAYGLQYFDFDSSLNLILTTIVTSYIFQAIVLAILFFRRRPS